MNKINSLDNKEYSSSITTNYLESFSKNNFIKKPPSLFEDNSKYKDDNNISFTTSYSKRPSIVSSNLKDFVKINNKIVLKNTFEISKGRNSVDLININDINKKKSISSSVLDYIVFNNFKLNKSDVKVNFKVAPPLFTTILKYMDENIDHYIHHTKAYIEFDSNISLKSIPGLIYSNLDIKELDISKLSSKNSITFNKEKSNNSFNKQLKIPVFIFIFMKSIYFTNPINEDDLNAPIKNPLLLSISHKKIFHKKHEINTDLEEGNYINIHYYDDDLSTKIEL